MTKLRQSTRQNLNMSLISKKIKFSSKILFQKKMLKPFNADDIKKYQVGFGYTKEDLNFFISPMFKDGVEPIGSMGTDTPISLLCDRSKLLYSYFKQCFAQVTNPPIDPIREELVMSLKMTLGAKPNIFSVPKTKQML